MKKGFTTEQYIEEILALPDLFSINIFNTII